MNKFIVSLAAAAALGGGAAYYYSLQGSGEAELAAPAEGEAMVPVTMPATFSPQAQMGERAFEAVCSDCHGETGAGRMGFGPPLVHKIYEPSHHGDMAFQLAVQNGVRAHHWNFGNMPAQSGLTRADVEAIVAYVRELQRANGIN